MSHACRSIGIAVALCASVAVAEPPTETRVYFGSCVFGAMPVDKRTLGVAVAGGLVDAGVDRLGQALRAAGEKYTSTIVAQRNYEAGYGGACLQLVHGRFNTVAQDAPVDATLDRKIGRSKLGEYAAALDAAGIRLASRPDVFLELELRRSRDNSAFALAPTFLSYSRSVADGRYRPRTTRVLAVQARLHPPGAAANERGSTGGTVLLGNVALGSEIEFEAADPVSGARPVESAWFPGLGTPAVPFTLTVSVTETRDERPILLFLADLLEITGDAL